MASLKKKIEKAHSRTLTPRQMTFARHIVEGIYSNAESARKAGYKKSLAQEHASRLLNGRDYPHVLEYIQEMRDERERRYGVSTIGQLQRLHQLSEGAEEAGQFSAAINAEKTRSALGGLTTDRRETNHYHAIENMDRQEIESRLEELRKSHPHAFVDAEYEVLNESETRDTSLEQNQVKDTPELEHHTD